MPTSTRRRPLALAITTAVLATGLAALQAPVAVADTLPPEGTPETVAADALPTVQIDGVVWKQAIAGNTVYAGGEFANARPAGAAPGTQLVPRRNLLRYDIRTGVLDPSWAPNPNAQVMDFAVSPDRSRVYVVGSFTNASGTTRNRIAAYSTATGALVTSFNPGADAQVRAVDVSPDGSTVYVGGIFAVAGGQPRTKLAAFDAATGAVKPWAPTVAAGRINAIKVSPDGSTVVVGGNFTEINGTTADSRGMVRLDATTGAKLPFPANATIWWEGDRGANLGLHGDGENVYGIGYTHSRVAGTLEGIFAADWDTGELVWVNDCHGDSYGVHAQGSVVYQAGHSHFCGNVQSFAQPEPTWGFYRGIAMTADARSTVQREHLGYTNFEGRPAPTVLNWFPKFEVGEYTGQTQGPWAVTGDQRYIVMGGEFPLVNNRLQQGLVRFAVRDLAPNNEGPRYSGDVLQLSARPVAQRAVRVSWLQNADYDNTDLTYRVFRNGNTTTPVYVGKGDNEDWNRAFTGFTDTTVTPGATYTYQVRTIDPYGNSTNSSVVEVTADGTGTLGDYPKQVLADGASHYWRLGDGTGTTGRDTAAARDLTTGSGVVKGQAGAIVGDPDTAYRMSNTTASRLVQPTAVQGRIELSVEAWFRTNGSAGNGPILGFGNRADTTLASTSRDRMLYVDNGGRVQFGVYPGTPRTVRSTQAYNDGQWHHTVATLGDQGMRLYVDGELVAQRTDTKTARNLTGYWRSGDSLSIYPNAPTTQTFNGWLDELAVYPYQLDPGTVALHHGIGTTGETPDVPPSAAFSTATSDLRVDVDGSGSTDVDGTVTSWAWDFGDGTTATGATAAHTYAAGGTYTVELTVTDDDGMTSTTTRSVTVTPNQAPVATFTATTTGLQVALDASAARDEDGTLATYFWRFGDGTTATGERVTHTYAADGTYVVILTVTDDDGATDTANRAVIVTAPPDPVLARDAFGRTVTGGWGSADAGGAWTASGPADRFSVGGGVARHTVPAGATLASVLGGVSSTSTDVQVLTSIDRVPPATSFVSVIGRRADATSYYGARVRIGADGSVQLHVTRGNGTPVAGGVVSGTTFAAGDRLRVRLQVEGTSPTTVRAKLWRDGTTEPAAWSATMSDGTIPALQAAGGVALQSYIGGVSTQGLTVFSYDDLRVARIE